MYVVLRMTADKQHFSAFDYKRKQFTIWPIPSENRKLGIPYPQLQLEINHWNKALSQTPEYSEKRCLIPLFL